MRKWAPRGFVLAMTALCLPTLPPSRALESAPHKDYTSDIRLKILHRFFTASGCPAAEYASVFLEAADNNGLDWRVLPSISYVESTGGKAAAGNNLFGWDSGRASFATPAAGIHTVGYMLAHSVRYGRKDLDRKLQTYNPDPDYSGKVKAVMRRISPNRSPAVPVARDAAR